jgi:signal transduction histidine kinase
MVLQIALLTSLVDRLHKQAEQLRALAARLQSVREEERTRVAREIHDELGQALTAIKIDFASPIGELRPNQDRESIRPGRF